MEADHRDPMTGSMVYVLLATYNGQRFLAEQLESIRSQSFDDWRLLVRDDGSNDRTVESLRAAAAADDRIELVDDARGRLGLLGNFNALMEAALERGADYIFFADQDDVWHPHKMRWQLECMRHSEAEADDRGPRLVHSDMEVVDEKLRIIHRSFMDFQGIRHEAQRPLETLLAQNFVTGCTTLINRPLLELATPLTSRAALHDWWIALCAAAAGRIVFLPQATVQYRQHAANAVGAKGRWSPAYWRRKLSAAQLRRLPEQFQRCLLQAFLLEERLNQRGAGQADSRRLVHGYCQAFSGNQGRFARFRQIRRLQIRRQQLLMQLAYLLGACLTPGIEHRSTETLLNRPQFLMRDQVSSPPPGRR